MEKVKKIFVKYFGMFPDIISTTEHAYISPPSRIISSLTELSNFKNKKVLRLIMTDRYASNPEAPVQRICLPYLLNKNLFHIKSGGLKKEIIEEFNKDIIRVNDMLKDCPFFSLKEEVNYTNIINIYRNILDKIDFVDSVEIYNDIVKSFIDIFDLFDLSVWIKKTVLFDIDSYESRLFLKEALSVLSKIDPHEFDLFGEYLEKNKRLKYKDDNGIKNTISWSTYLRELDSVSMACFVPYEIILYVYSYCGGSHFGNDYGAVEHINNIRNNNNLVQLTKHNKDYVFNLELEDILFQNIVNKKDKWSASSKIHKTINTLPELYVVLGQDSLRNMFNNKLNFK